MLPSIHHSRFNKAAPSDIAVHVTWMLSSCRCGASASSCRDGWCLAWEVALLRMERPRGVDNVTWPFCLTRLVVVAWIQTLGQWRKLGPASLRNEHGTTLPWPSLLSNCTDTKVQTKWHEDLSNGQLWMAYSSQIVESKKHPRCGLFCGKSPAVMGPGACRHVTMEVGRVKSREGPQEAMRVML